MKILFYLGHPAHFHLFKNTITELEKKGHSISIAIKSKDVLSELLNNSDLAYFNLNPFGRKDNRIGIFFNLLNRDFNLFKLSLKFKPDILIGSAAEISHIGKILGKPSLVVFEDDLEEVSQFAKLAGPFATDLICPQSCSPGKWRNKAIQYNSYHELAYLSPKYNSPNFENIKNLFSDSKKIFLIRFAKLTAYHDEGKTGITREIAKNLIQILKPYGTVYISSERELEPEFETYRIKINPLNMHDVLNYASMYIGDSQTMTAEAAVLGTPAIRFNDFVGKLGYLEELEHKYHLTYGIKTSEPYRLIDKIKVILNTPDVKEKWSRKREKMLHDKIDLTSFLIWYIENYPVSKTVMKNNPDYQYHFKFANN